MPQGESSASSEGSAPWLAISGDMIRYHPLPAARKGLEEAEVRQFLTQIAQWFDGMRRHVADVEASAEESERRAAALERQVADLERELTEARLEQRVAVEQVHDESDAYKELAGRMAEVLRVVDHQAEEIRQQMEDKAASVEREALGRAEQVRRDADAEIAELHRVADEEIEAAREEAESSLREIEARQALARRELEHLRETSATVHRILERSVGPATPEAGDAGEAGVETDLEPDPGSDVESELDHLDGYRHVAEDGESDDPADDDYLGQELVALQTSSGDDQAAYF